MRQAFDAYYRGDRDAWLEGCDPERKVLRVEWFEDRESALLAAGLDR
jgi:hypothetical protein